MMETLQTGRAFGLSIMAGLVAGGILAGINVALVRPYTAALADIELENLLAESEFFEEEFDDRLQSIYFSQLYGSVIVGLAAGAGAGVTFVVGRIRASPLKAALIIAGIAWFVLYVIPAVKYPPSPEATFDPEAAGIYQMLLAGYTAVSGLAALAIAFGFRKVKRKEKALGAAALYLVAIAGAFFVFPDFQSEDDSFLPQPIVSGWRSAISLSMTVFWFALGIICGLLWTYGSRGVGRGI
ncbi:CbtA family protein [Candidatus Nitrososphaera gargensis]|nr:CbtA family protein [Candidatus Nitrososphaera gargensis]